MEAAEVPILENVRRLDATNCPIMKVGHKVGAVCPYLVQNWGAYYCSRETSVPRVILNFSIPFYGIQVGPVVLALNCFDEFDQCLAYRGAKRHLH